MPDPGATKKRRCASFVKQPELFSAVPTYGQISKVEGYTLSRGMSHRLPVLSERRSLRAGSARLLGALHKLARRRVLGWRCRERDSKADRIHGRSMPQTKKPSAKD
jgi:hypothetical protein